MEKAALLREIKPHKALLRQLGAVKGLAGAATLSAAALTAELLDTVLQDSLSIEKAVPLLMVLLFVLSLRAGLTFPAKRLSCRLSLSVQENIRRRLHLSLLHASPLAPAIKSGGRLSALFLETVDGLDRFFTVCLPGLLELLVLVPFFLLSMLFIDLPTALLFLLTLPIAPFLLYLIGRLTKKRSERQWQQLQQLDSRFAELLRGIPMLKLFNRSREQQCIIQKDSEAFSQASLDVLELAFLSSFILELITTLAIALIAVSIGLRLIYGDVSFFTAFWVLLLAPEFYQPLRQSGTAFHAGMEALSAARELESFSAAAPFLQDAPATGIGSPKAQAVRFSKVSCRYPQRQALALNKLSFVAVGGSITALAGTSGSGKSTVFSLLLGAMQPSSGNIELDGQPLSSLSSAERRAFITYVPQEPHLLTASLRENLSLGRTGCTDNMLCQALCAAGLEELLSLPAGLDTDMGDGTTCLLSTGQRRRLGLARALIHPSPVLLLDEITAGLDAAAEKQILEAICSLAGKHTILLASHRPATLKIAYTVIWLDAGKEALT